MKSRILLSPPSCNKRSKKKRNRKKNKKNSFIHESTPTPTSHVGDEISTTTTHAGGISLVTTSHTSNESPTSVSHIFVGSPPSMSRTRGTSPITLRKESLTSVSHVGDSPPTTASHVGRMDVDKKPRHKRFKPNFHCNLCKGDHITHLFSGILVVQRLWYESDGSSTPESVMVSQLSNQLLVDEVSSQCNLLLIPLFFWGVKSLTIKPS